MRREGNCAALGQQHKFRIFIRFHRRLRRKLDPRLKHVFTVTHSLKEGTEKTGERRPFAVDRENQIGGFWPRKAHGILNCASRYWRGHDENA